MVVLPLSRLPNDDANMNTPNADPAPQGERAAPHVSRYPTPCTVRTRSAPSLRRNDFTWLSLFVAATGTALALMDQQDLLRKWWAVLPQYIDDIQELLNQAEGAVEEFAAQREKLGNVLGR